MFFFVSDTDRKREIVGGGRKAIQRRRDGSGCTFMSHAFPYEFSYAYEFCTRTEFQKYTKFRVRKKFRTLGRSCSPLARVGLSISSEDFIKVYNTSVVTK